MSGVTTIVSREHRALARELTGELFKQHGKPKGEKPGPQFAIHRSLELMKDCLAGEIITLSKEQFESYQDGDMLLIRKDEYKAMQQLQNKLQAMQETAELLAKGFATSAIMLGRYQDTEAAEKEASELKPAYVEAFSKSLLAFALDRIAAAVLETEHNAAGDDQPGLLKLAKGLMNDADILRAFHQQQHSTTH